MITLSVNDGRSSFAPGDDIVGVIAWAGEQHLAWVEVRLFWYTEGKGTMDVGVASSERFSDLGLQGGKTFRVAAPAAPPSCSGRLVSIRWALELVSADDQPVVKVDLVIAPGAREIVLGHVD